MGALVLAAIIAPSVVVALVAIGAGIHLRYVFPGVLDGKFPLVADGDHYPIGSRRRALYLFGLEHGRREVERDRERRRLTTQRRSTISERKDI